MDKRQLRQSAVADFLQSLEQLDELLRDTTDTVVLDDGSQPDKSNGGDALPLAAHHPISTPHNNQATSRQDRR